MDNDLQKPDTGVPLKRLVIRPAFGKSGKRIGIAIGCNTRNRTFVAGVLWRGFGWLIVELTERHDFVQVGPLFAGTRSYNNELTARVSGKDSDV